ncbi:hypothetical protein GOB27_30420 [Sinorhizobium meliloti]|nr:hypothetical protein [Sinorhizobium meliloti]
MKLQGALPASVLLVVLQANSASPQTAPAYDAEDQFLLPNGYETWVFVGSNLGLEYKSGVAAMTASETRRAEEQAFHNIYIDPAAYAEFVRSGTFPDPTILIMENYVAEARDDGGILKEGVFNGQRRRVEAAVKDSRRPTRPDSKENWAYYAFSLDSDGKPLPASSAMPDQACYSCHKLHAVKDNVWVQFYPHLRRWVRL